MRSIRIICTIAVIGLLAIVGGCSPDHKLEAGMSGARANGAATASEAAMDLDQLYSLPSLIGTTPELATWSRDEEWLAFAWNEEGGPFRDVWLYSAASGDLSRLTRHGEDVEAGSLHPGVSELAWLGAGADGLAYVLDGKLYQVDRSGHTQAIEQPQEHIRQLQVAPNGQYLSYVADAGSEGDGQSQSPGRALWVAALDDGKVGPAERLVNAEQEHVYVESYEWSANGTRIAFLRADETGMPVREIRYYANDEAQIDRVVRAFPGEETSRRSLGVVELGDRSIRWLTLPDDQYPVWSYGLSVDGTRLFANTSDFVVKEHTIYVFDVATGGREIFYRFNEPENVVPAWGAAWAPDDDGLIILTDRDGFYHLYHQREAGSEPRMLTSGEWEIASFVVDDAGRQIYFVANKSHPAERQVYRMPFDGGPVEALTQEPGTWAPTFSPDFDRVALHFSSDVTPPDLYVRDISSDGKVDRITHSPRPAFADYTWAEVRYPEFTSHVDGTRLYGRLSVPQDFDASRRYPLIVGSVYANTLRNQWGGRTAHPTWGLDQYFVSRGYLVLNVDVRGSWGHGKAFSQGLIRDYGGIDIEDIESGVRYLVEQGFVDSDRVGIWGSSYGGLMTMMSLFEKPGLYAAGIAGAPATNVWHAFPSQMWVMGEPHGDDYPERYRRQSPLFHSDGLEDPLMIIHGTKDSVVLYLDTIALVERLITGGNQFELVTLPGGNHGWDTDSLEQTRFAYKKMADFFDRYLK